MTRHRDPILQPEGFRAESDVPEWVHFPLLHLLLGWGPGVWETIGDGIAGLRHVFLPVHAAARRPPIAAVIDWRDRYYMFSKLREQAPPLVIEGVGGRNVLFDLGDGGLKTADAPCADGAAHVIVPDGEYLVLHEHGEAGSVITLARRTKALKAEYRAKLAALGSAEDAARTFAAHVAKTKATYVERRTKELLKDAARRPPDFGERMAAHVRSRMGEIERRKRDGLGRPKRPYPPDELLRRTCGEIARTEATDLMFDYGTKVVCILSADGFRTFS